MWRTREQAPARCWPIRTFRSSPVSGRAPGTRLPAGLHRSYALVDIRWHTGGIAGPRPAKARLSARRFWKPLRTASRSRQFSNSGPQSGRCADFHGPASVPGTNLPAIAKWSARRAEAGCLWRSRRASGQSNHQPSALRSRQRQRVLEGIPRALRMQWRSP